jgi:hypothetical protein
MVIERNYTFREAEEFGPKAKTWMNWYYKGLLRTIRLGRRIYIPQSEILRLLAAGENPARRTR